jgi:hypothetical protein
VSDPTAGADWDAIENALHTCVVAASKLPQDHVYWGLQTNSPRVGEPAIELKFSLSDDDGTPEVDTCVNYLSLPSSAVTGFDLSTSTLVVPGHSCLTGDGPVRLTSDAGLPAPLVQGQEVWVIAPDVTHVRLARTFQNALDGIAITLATEGSGNRVLTGTDHTLRAGEEMIYTSRSCVSVTLLMVCWAVNGVGLNSAFATLRRVASRLVLPSVAGILAAANIGVLDVDKVKTIKGIRNAVQFEPRAVLDVILSIPVEEGEFGGIIERINLQRLAGGGLSEGPAEFIPA